MMFTVPRGSPLRPPPTHPPNHNKEKLCPKGKQKQLMFSSDRPEIAQDDSHTEEAKSNLSLPLKKKPYYRLHLTQVCGVGPFLSNCQLDQGGLLGGKSGF